jgi:hypothetical protein
MNYFITEAYLKLNTDVTENVDANDIIPLVKTSADMWVRSILGTYFYKDLLTKYNNQTLNADETTLVQDYIQSSVAWRSAADCVVSLSYQLKNKGIQTQRGDFSDSPEYKALMWNYHNKDQKANFYDNRLKTYLIENKDLYPVFLDDLNIDSTAKRECGGDDSSFQDSIFFV